MNKTIKNTVQIIQITVNTSKHIAKTTRTLQNPQTYTHPHITVQVKTTTVQDTHQMK